MFIITVNYGQYLSITPEAAEITITITIAITITITILLVLQIIMSMINTTTIVITITITVTNTIITRELSSAFAAFLHKWNLSEAGRLPVAATINPPRPGADELPSEAQ